MCTVAPNAAAEHDAATLDLLCQLVAGTYRSPSEALEADLASGAFAAALAALADRLGLRPPTLAKPSRPALQSSYTDLFVSSGRGLTAPPYVGYALDGALMGPSAQLLGAGFADHGIELKGDWNDLPDHVTAVAEGGLHLLRADRVQPAFELMQGYLAPWFERYASAIETNDASGFYGPVSRFLHHAIREVTRETRS